MLHSSNASVTSIKGLSRGCNAYRPDPETAETARAELRKEMSAFGKKHTSRTPNSHVEKRGRLLFSICERAKRVAAFSYGLTVPVT
jgi:hypothetical protein